MGAEVVLEAAFELNLLLMNLKELRSTSGLTIKALAEEVEVDERRLRIIERGLDRPDKGEISKLTEYFELDKKEVRALKKKGHIEVEPLIGEGYVTALDRVEFTVYPPSVEQAPNKLRVLDLFCGIGGLSYGFEQTGEFSTVGGLDLLSDRIATFQKNHEHSFGFSFDINQFAPSELRNYLSEAPHVIVGGAPCQGFSSIRPFRTLSENDRRNNLFRSFAGYVNHFKPEWFVFENVVGLLTHKGGASLQVLIGEFESLGYSVDFRVLNAAYYGVPQLRERLIVVGNRIGVPFSWPEPTHYIPFKSMAGNNNPKVLKPRSMEDCEPIVTVMDALSDLPALRSGEHSEVYLTQRPLNAYQAYLREGSKGLNLHEASVHSPSMLKVIEASGYNIESVRHLVSSGFSSSYSRLEPDRPSVTLTVNFVCPSSNKCIHPEQQRALTPREGARLQGFPDRFDFAGSRTQIVKQIGNAVPPNLSRVVAERIFSYY